MRVRTNSLLAATRILAISGVSATLYFAYLLRRLTLRDPQARFDVVPRWLHRWAMLVGKLAGVTVSSAGEPPARPVLLCPNHLGYADVLALASVAPCFFVSRADAADWPLLGPLIRISEQVLVSRKKSRDLAATSREISRRLRAGQRVCVFLEGTSTEGDRVLPLLPALLKSAGECDVPVAPVAITWSSDQPGVSVAEDIAYWGEHNIVTHLWRFAGIGGKRVRVEFGAPRPARHRNRKELAAELRSEILQMKGFPEEEY
jgi:1-acyl-sn-glycerol-3-phosphate acyltransferase